MKMKIPFSLLLGFLATVSLVFSAQAQDVYIQIPAANIFNRTELNTVKTVLFTGNHTNWRAGARHPTIKSTSGNNFTHTTLPNTFLSTDILQWQLASIGGGLPPFRGGDPWPIPYKWFTPSDQTWYQPRTSTGGQYNSGNIDFNFEMPSNKFVENKFYAGNYSLGITHNYGSSGFYAIEFTPNSFNMILTIPAAISWLSNTPTKYIEISSLDDYRVTSPHILGNLGAATLANTVSFNLNAKASSSLIQFTSSKSVAGNINISLIRLSSTNSKIINSPLSATWKNFTPINNLKVETGNRNNFTLELSISAVDFKTHFFQAGTYTFQLNLDAKATDNSLSSMQNTDVTIKVLPLSEITIPTSGQAVNFDFNTATHYQQGQSKIIPNHIKLSNNESFELYVKSDVSFFKNSGIQSDINSTILEIGVNGSVSVPLSPTPQKIITNGVPLLDGELDIKYSIPANAAQILVGKEKTSYSINVIYSFTAI